MILLRTLILFLAVSLAVSFASGQDGDSNIHRSVLKKGVADSTFIFGKWSESGNTETHLKYLGEVITKRGQTFNTQTVFQKV